MIIQTRWIEIKLIETFHRLKFDFPKFQTTISCMHGDEISKNQTDYNFNLH